MGGYGSGRWSWHDKRSTVESSLYITPKILRKGFGTVHWNCNGEPSGWIGYKLTEYGVTLEYKWRDEPVTEPIRIERGRVGFMQGEWFLCPLLKPNGRPCHRRCRKLYAPYGAKYFGCRECYNLTYQSSNESHKYDGVFAMLARETGATPEMVRRVLNGK
jgi:hypothetical protein